MIIAIFVCPTYRILHALPGSFKVSPFDFAIDAGP